MPDEASFRNWHEQAIERQLQCDRLDREENWSTAVAVGDSEWHAWRVQQRQLERHRIIEADNDPGSHIPCREWDAKGTKSVLLGNL